MAINIRIHDDVWQRLHERKQPGDSFNDVVNRVLDQADESEGLEPVQVDLGHTTTDLKIRLFTCPECGVSVRSRRCLQCFECGGDMKHEKKLGVVVNE